LGQADLLARLKEADAKDATKSLTAQLIAARLNQASGAGWTA